MGSVAEMHLRPRGYALRRFKAIARLVIQNKFWLMDLDEDMEITENVQQNVQRLKHRKKGYKQLFTLEEKSILNKPAHERTDKEKLRISRIIQTLNCFSRYPEHVKEKLAGVCYFCYYGPGRIIVKQGHPSQCMYFITSGEVNVVKTLYDELDEDYYDKQVGVLTEGSLFGEVALLHNIARQASIITATNCEFLKMWKEDFDKIMKETIQKKWHQIQAGMNLMQYFDLWTPMQVRECCIISRLKDYDMGTIIMSADRGPSSYVYFILAGQVEIIEELSLYQWLDRRGNKKYSLVSGGASNLDVTKTRSDKSVNTLLEDLDDVNLTLLKPIASTQKTLFEGIKRTFVQKAPAHAKYVKHFIRVCYLNQKACFGLGELSKNRLVVATKRTKCLLIPRYFLLNNNTSNEWTKIKRYLQKHIPTTEVIMKKFILEQKWRKYKETLIKQSFLNKSPVNALHNIPYSIRLKEFYEN